MIKKIFLFFIFFMSTHFLHSLETPPIDLHFHVPSMTIPPLPAPQITLPPAWISNGLGALSIGITAANTLMYAATNHSCNQNEKSNNAAHRAVYGLSAGLSITGLSLSLAYEDGGWKLNLGALACAAAALAGLEWWEKKN